MATLSEFDLYSNAEAAIEGIKAINASRGHEERVTALDGILHSLVDVNHIPVGDGPVEVIDYGYDDVEEIH